MNMHVSEKLKKYKVSIFGESYYLISDEPEKHVMNAAQLVDSCMKEIAHKSKDTEIKRIAVLVALQLASQALIAKSAIENNQKHCDKLLDLVNQELA